MYVCSVIKNVPLKSNNIFAKILIQNFKQKKITDDIIIVPVLDFLSFGYTIQKLKSGFCVLIFKNPVNWVCIYKNIYNGIIKDDFLTSNVHLKSNVDF